MSHDKEVFTLATLNRARAAAQKNRIEPIWVGGRLGYVMTVPPRAWAILVMIGAKARWKQQYRAERLARRQRNA